MRRFLEFFAIPVLAASFVYIVSDQWHLPERVRIPVALSIAVIAGIIGAFVGRVERETSRGRGLFTMLALVLAGSAIFGLLYLGRRPKSPTARLQIDGASPDSQAIASQPPSTPGSVNLAGRAAKPLAPKNGLLGYVSASPRRSGSGVAWATSFYGENGKDYPVLRGAAQDAVRRKGISTPSLFTTVTPAAIYAEIANGNEATIVQLKPYCDGIVLGKVTDTTAPSDQFSGMYSSHLSLDVKLISTAEGVAHEFLIDDYGSGFSAGDSEVQAEKRVAQKLATALGQSFVK